MGRSFQPAGPGGLICWRLAVDLCWPATGGPCPAPIHHKASRGMRGRLAVLDFPARIHRSPRGAAGLEEALGSPWSGCAMQALGRQAGCCQGRRRLPTGAPEKMGRKGQESRLAERGQAVWKTRWEGGEPVSLCLLTIVHLTKARKESGGQTPSPWRWVGLG